jgi:hypothetical protein
MTPSKAYQWLDAQLFVRCYEPEIPDATDEWLARSRHMKDMKDTCREVEAFLAGLPPGPSGFDHHMESTTKAHRPGWSDSPNLSCAEGEWETRFMHKKDTYEEVNAFLASLPPGPDGFYHHMEPPTMTAEYYHGWLSLLRREANSLLAHLDLFEARYRTLGFKYHRIPSAARHLTDRHYGHMCTRLAQLFEYSGLRKDQAFFYTWFKIFETAFRSLKHSAHLSQETSVEILQQELPKVEHALESIAKEVPSILTNLDAIETIIAKLKTVAGDYWTIGQFEHNTELAYLVEWVGSFPEAGNYRHLHPHDFIYAFEPQPSTVILIWSRWMWEERSKMSNCKDIGGDATFMDPLS